MTTTLTPIYSTQKSFYSKACVIEDKFEDKIIKTLMSYDTPVAESVEDNKSIKIKSFGWWSKTTQIHQTEFFKQELKDPSVVINKKRLSENLRITKYK